MNTATKETTIFTHYKAMVASEAGITIERLDQFRPRLHAAFDMGEPVWMVADEMRLRAQSPMKTKTPRQLAARVQTLTA